MNPAQPRASVTLCAIVRDEAAYILEWIAWNKLLGFDPIVIYDNESADDGPALLAALQAAGEIVVRPWPDRPGAQAQLPAYRDAIARCATEWIAFLDADEFLVLRRHSRLPDLLAAVPGECAAIAFNQRVFGSSGHARFEPQPVIARFLRSGGPVQPLNAWIKTVARAAQIRDLGPHGCTLAAGHYVDPGGSKCGIENMCRNRAIRQTVAYYNHYIVKSREEYLAKRARGRCDVPPEDPARLDKYTDAFFNAHDLNTWPDDRAARRLPLVLDEMARLRAHCPDLIDRLGYCRAGG